ncbi:hypothetical protein WMF37_18605 [Sorangium sp. So ce291]|uniref:hypothetical protein n=1 Tax=Sorangium sp. So ce291 TaxID=3133294 RepID=UPI003F638701
MNKPSSLVLFLSLLLAAAGCGSTEPVETEAPAREALRGRRYCEMWSSISAIDARANSLAGFAADTRMSARISLIARMRGRIVLKLPSYSLNVM